MRKLEDAIEQSGLGGNIGIRKKYRVNYCMADSGNAVTITPTGYIGLCDHYSESEFIGHIKEDGFDTSVIRSWQETEPEIPECATCFYLPECIRLKKCAYRRVCFAELRNGRLRKQKRQMRNEYTKWKGQEETEDFANEETC
jgi:radical SAM protein with 4Fe4S-binding SPASM domain